MPKRAIASDRVRKPSIPFAQATVAGGFMFVCCTGVDREGRFARGDVRAQTRQAIENIRALIEQALDEVRAGTDTVDVPAGDAKRHCGEIGGQPANVTRQMT